MITFHRKITVLRICSLVCFTKVATVILSTQTSLHHNGIQNLTLSVNSYIILYGSSVDRRLCPMAKYVTFCKYGFVNLNRVCMYVYMYVCMYVLLLLLNESTYCFPCHFMLQYIYQLLIIYSKMWSRVKHKIWLYMSGSTGRGNPYVNAFCWELRSSGLLRSE